MPLFSAIPKIGQLAPDFLLEDQDGKLHSLGYYEGKKLVVYFFPKAFTPGWTKQACGFRDESDNYKELGIVVLGISFDSKNSLKAFKEKYRIPFNFLSDYEKNIGKKYGVSRFFFASRKTFLIDENGILIHIIDEVNLNTHPMDIIKIFEQAEKGANSWMYLSNIAICETIYHRLPVWK